jgi:hypothetical protein
LRSTVRQLLESKIGDERMDRRFEAASIAVECDVSSAEIVARCEAELGIQLISEIVSVAGAELLGPFLSRGRP